MRILIDDFNLKDLRRDCRPRLDAHPNIEVRLFNPFALRPAASDRLLTDFERVNHRMHNKLMVMDNAMAIVGGQQHERPVFRECYHEFNFRDLDIAAAGPVVRELSSVFDRFWNGPWSVPIAALVDRPYVTEADLSGNGLKRYADDRAPPLPASAGTRMSPSSRAQWKRTSSFGRDIGRAAVSGTIRPRSTIPRLRTCARLLVNRLEQPEKGSCWSSQPISSALGPGVEFSEGIGSRGVRIRSADELACLQRRACRLPGYSKVP